MEESKADYGDFVLVRNIPVSARKLGQVDISESGLFYYHKDSLVALIPASPSTAFANSHSYQRFVNFLIFYATQGLPWPTIVEQVKCVEGILQIDRDIVLSAYKDELGYPHDKLQTARRSTPMPNTQNLEIVKPAALQPSTVDEDEAEQKIVNVPFSSLSAVRPTSDTSKEEFTTFFNKYPDCVAVVEMEDAEPGEFRFVFGQVVRMGA